MVDDSFYVGFAAFIQLTVGFNFGLLYLYKNNRSIFKSIQTTVFDGFRQNALTKLFLSYPKHITEQIKPKTHGAFFCKCKASAKNSMNAISAACNYERTCDYIAATGIVSAFFGLEWLLLVPWAYKYLPDAQYVYGTCTIVVVLTTLFMLLHSITGHITRGKMFMLASISFALFHFIAFKAWPDGWKMDFCSDFDNIFLWSMFVAVAPIVYFLLHIALLIVLRMIHLVGLICGTMALDAMLRVRKLVCK